MFIHGPFPTDIYLDAGQMGLIDESLIDENFLNQFLAEKKVRIKGHTKQSIANRTRKLNYSISSNIERTIFALRFTLDDFTETSGSAEYIFENNNMYFYEFGTCLFSTEVTGKYQGEVCVQSLKEADKFARDIIVSKLEKELKNYNRAFSEFIDSKNLKRIPRIAHSFELGHLAWGLHTVYYFSNLQLFEDDDTNSVRGQLKDDIYRDFCLLLDQAPEDMSPLIDRYVFYGSGKSLILTEPSVTQEDVIRLVGLLETFQYFNFGLYQLDTFLTKEMYNLNTEGYNEGDESAGYNRDEQLKKIRSKIKQLENIRSSTIRYLEQFRYSSNVVFLSGEHILIQKLEDQWGLDHIERGIRNKLDLFERDLSSQERALLSEEQKFITEKQDYLNKLVMVIAVVSLANVIAQFVILSPLKEVFPEGSLNIFPSQLLVASLTSAVIILSVLILYTRRLEKIRTQRLPNLVHRKSKIKTFNQV